MPTTISSSLYSVSLYPSATMSAICFAVSGFPSLPMTTKHGSIELSFAEPAMVEPDGPSTFLLLFMTNLRLLAAAAACCFFSASAFSCSSVLTLVKSSVGTLTPLVLLPTIGGGPTGYKGLMGDADDVPCAVATDVVLLPAPSNKSLGRQTMELFKDALPACNCLSTASEGSAPAEESTFPLVGAVVFSVGIVPNIADSPLGGRYLYSYVILRDTSSPLWLDSALPDMGGRGPLVDSVKE